MDMFSYLGGNVKWEVEYVYGLVLDKGVLVYRQILVISEHLFDCYLKPQERTDIGSE